MTPALESGHGFTMHECIERGTGSVQIKWPHIHIMIVLLQVKIKKAPLVGK